MEPLADVSRGRGRHPPEAQSDDANINPDSPPPNLQQDLETVHRTASYKLRYIVGLWLVEMAISTNHKPTIYRNLYQNTDPAAQT